MSDCEKCGKPHDEHPSVDVSGMDRFYICQDRAAKWVRVEPGTVIPAGQPYRVEYDDGDYAEEDRAQKVLEVPRSSKGQWFVDSSWKPPLVLPTEPTWGIVATKGYRTIAGRWHRLNGVTFFNETAESVSPDDIVAWIPLTDEQVKRIEAAR